MRFSLYKRQVALTAVVTFVFIFVGFLASFLAMQWERERTESSRPLVWAKLVDQIAERSHISKAAAVEIINSANATAGMSDLTLISSTEAKAYAANHETKLPEIPYQIKNTSTREFISRSEHLVLLSGPEENYLVVSPKTGIKNGVRARPNSFLINFIALNVSVFLASTFSLFLLFYSMREKAKLARDIIAEMKQGNLKVRFPIKRMDEVGHLMTEFNKMADEIERLVERIKSTELARMKLLQELAHDLRTPVASMKSLLETLSLRREELEPKMREELMSLSLREIEYFERLVEDLLFLAQVTEPKYQANKTVTSISDLIEEELEACAARYASRGHAIQIEKNFPQSLPTMGGDQHLLRRLFRNAFDNAFSFAKNRVSVRVKNEGDFFNVEIDDDGPGLTPQAQAAYGEKRVTRMIATTGTGRLSVGLGSVIIKAIAGLHEGTVSIDNLPKTADSLGGARLNVKLKMG